MLSTDATSTTGSVFSAIVIDEDRPNRMVRVRQSTADAALTGWARVAIPDANAPRTGDEVVVAGDLSDQAFVIGLLSSIEQRVETNSGAAAEIRRTDDGDESIRVMSPENQLLFEFLPESGTCRLNVPDGNLDVTTPRGGIRFAAQGNVQIEGDNLSLSARRNLLLTVSQSIGKVCSRLTLLPGRIRAGSKQFQIDAEEIETRSRSTTTISEDISATSTRHQIKTSELSTTAETVTENAGNIYRRVSELLQVQAGRYRAFISGLSHFRSKKAYFSSEESMNIDGDKINIG